MALELLAIVAVVMAVVILAVVIVAAAVVIVVVLRETNRRIPRPPGLRLPPKVARSGPCGLRLVPWPSMRLQML